MAPPKIMPTAISEVLEIVPVRHFDDRGWFSETWNRAELAKAGIASDWVQDNESVSFPKATLRGIHFQLPPESQDKLVRVIAGSILDIAVDLRQCSETFREHVAIELRADKGNQLFIPSGFGHAFCTLEANTRVAYKVSNHYSPEHDRILRYDDPGIGIVWPFLSDCIILSKKDASAPNLDELIASRSLF